MATEQITVWSTFSDLAIKNCNCRTNGDINIVGKLRKYYLSPMIRAPLGFCREDNASDKLHIYRYKDIIIAL